ncbi:jg15589 [Pararge aegeria aegeria]|uniref:Jg15589 protein n=1 Tax=Pararge aegeria aegeria TaxID=348720 RepID=A0A8S4RWL9_9NEOP|nr:jg15589 [Pararge aegeria aegeria]
MTSLSDRTNSELRVMLFLYSVPIVARLPHRYAHVTFNSHRGYEAREQGECRRHKKFSIDAADAWEKVDRKSTSKSTLKISF